MRALSVIGIVIATFGLAAVAQGPVQVVATSVVLGDLVEWVGGDAVVVTTLIPAGFCPAHYDLRPSDLLAVAKAELVLYHGIEPWLERLLANVNPRALVLPLPGEWNTPDPLAEKAHVVAAALARLRPGSEGEFAQRTEGFVQELLALEEEILSQAQEFRLGEVPAIVMAWQADFASWLGLGIVATYPPEERLSLRDLVELSSQGQAARALLVVDNLQSGVDFGARLAHELSAVHVVLTNFPGAIPGTPDLIGMLSRNAQAVFAAVAAVRGEG
jgi:ABC-type Zn uptake system ZnuABC Zn-binding protein ZnuA